MRILLLILLLSGTAFADCRLSQILVNLSPGAIWSMENEDYTTLNWVSGVRPTKQEVIDAVATCKADEANRATLKDRARYEIKLSTITAAQAIKDLLLLLDLDR